VAANRLRPRSLPRLLLVGLHEVAAMLAGRYARREGAHGLVRDADGAVLVVRPLFPPREWTLPGGKVGKRETPHAAAVREVLEETGLEVEVERCLLVDAHRSRTTDFVFACRLLGGELRAQPEEIMEVRWMTVSELPALSPRLADFVAGLAFRGEAALYRR